MAMPMEVTAKLEKGKRYRADLNEELAIDEKKINDELAEQPTQFAWWAKLHEEARGLRDEVKRRLDLFWAERDRDIREDKEKYEKEVGGRLTDKAIEALITTDPNYQTLNVEYLEARRQEGILQVAREAFIQRKDALMEIAKNRRFELDVDLTAKLEAAAKRHAIGAGRKP